jgi:hypothetical protein
MPPFAPFGLHFVSAPRPLERALDASGTDVTAALAEVDRKVAGAGARERFRGYAKPWSLELDFGRLDDDARTRPVVLIAHGWIEFSNSTPMYAAAQAGLGFALPALDVLDDAGQVVGTIADAGAPAGLPKWMALELTGKLPKDGRVRLRYRSNMEIYFDQVLLGSVDPAAPRVIRDVEPEQAELSWTGYPTAWNPDGGRPSLYRYDRLRPDETWTSQEGFYTRFGDVRELLAEEDDRMVVMSHGDELRLPSGWKRHLVLYSVGYAKDLDGHSAAPMAVGPLPWRKMPSYPYPGAGPLAREEVRQALASYNSRYVRPALGGLE